jgi:hypothetical protein
MTSSRFALALIIALPCAAFAAGGGGGTGGVGGAGAASSRSSSTGANTGPAGGGSPAVSGVPSGPAQTGGLNNSVNDPAGVLNANKTPSTNSGTVGLAPARPSEPPVNPNGVVREPAPGANSLGAAGASGGTPAGGPSGVSSNQPTTKGEQASDARIDAENRKTDKAINNVCRGC